MNYIIGLDIGTSNIKAVLFDADGRIIFSVKKNAPIITSEDCLAAVDPEGIVDLSLQAVSEITVMGKQGNYNPDILGISCNMHGIMAVDISDKPVTPLYLWTDTRSIMQARGISPGEIEDFYGRTGCRLDHPMYPVSKILYLNSSRNKSACRINRFAGLKDYLLFQFCKEWIVDPGMAGAQGMMNIHNFAWDEKVLDLLDLDSSKLSSIVPASTVIKLTSHEIAGRTGLPVGFPVHIGSGDGILANIALSPVDSEMIVSTIGTSGALRMTEKEPLLDEEKRTWSYPFDKFHWINGGAINNAGLAMRWMYKACPQQAEYDAAGNSEDVYRTFDRQAEQIPPGSNGLVFLPLLTGERSPDWNASVRGMMFGLDYSHGRGHIIRAALEGVMFRMCSVYKTLTDRRNKMLPLLASGGYSESVFWLKMQADVFNSEIYVSDIKEASALGAAKAAMVASGLLSSVDDNLAVNEIINLIQPDPETAAFYEKWYRRVEDLYRRNI